MIHALLLFRIPAVVRIRTLCRAARNSFFDSLFFHLNGSHFVIGNSRRLCLGGLLLKIWFMARARAGRVLSYHRASFFLILLNNGRAFEILSKIMRWIKERKESRLIGDRHRDKLKVNRGVDTARADRILIKKGPFKHEFSKSIHNESAGINHFPVKSCTTRNTSSQFVFDHVREAYLRSRCSREAEGKPGARSRYGHSSKTFLLIMTKTTTTMMIMMMMIVRKASSTVTLFWLQCCLFMMHDT